MSEGTKPLMKKAPNYTQLHQLFCITLLYQLCAKDCTAPKFQYQTISRQLNHSVPQSKEYCTNFELEQVHKWARYHSSFNTTITLTSFNTSLNCYWGPSFWNFYRSKLEMISPNPARDGRSEVYTVLKKSKQVASTVTAVHTN